jgi:AcrR family transcriptional regulator
LYRFRRHAPGGILRIAPQQGRPKIHTEDDVRRRVFEAFEDLLRQESTSTLSTAEIAKKAGVSKRTLYEVAPSKHALILGVLERSRVTPLSILDEPVPSTEAALAVLRRFLAEWMAAAFAPSSINLVRLAMDEWRKAPELGAVYAEAGGAFTTRRLTAWFEERQAHGELRLAHAGELAEVCRAVLIKQYLFAVAFGHRPAPDAGEVAARVAMLMTLLNLQPAP